MTDRKRSYPLGNRKKEFQPPIEQLSDARWAWTKNNIGLFMIMVNEVDDQAGYTIRLFFPTPGSSRNISWDLTGLTAEELIAMRQIFLDAFDWALPICRVRDKEAQDAFERGDDSYIRIYRAVPQLVYRNRPESEHSEGVQHRPEDVPQVDNADGDSDAGVRDEGDVVAERHEGGVEPKDNWPATHQPPVLRPVVGEPGIPPIVQGSDPGEGSASSDS